MCKWLMSLVCILLFSGVAHADVYARINKDEFRLYLYEDGKLIGSYPVSIGQVATYTPEGVFSIVHRIENPAWKGIPGGVPENPLGKFWLGLSVVSESGERYGIHGTNHPDRIGEAVSEGCVRMYNEDVSAIVWQLPVGSKVVIESRDSHGYVVDRNRKDKVWVKVWGVVPRYSELWNIGLSLI